MTKKIKYILLFSFLIILGLCTKSQARITTSDPTVSSGGTATITINSQEPVASGAIDVVSDGGLTFVSASGGENNGTFLAFAGSSNKTSGIATYKFKVPKVSKTTTYKVTFSAKDMTNASKKAIASSKATATVTVRGSSAGSSSSSESSSSSSSSSSSNSTSRSNDSDKDDEDTKPTFTDVNETVYATSSGINIRSSYSTSSSSIGTLSAGDELTRTGRATSAVDGITWSRVTYNGQTAYVSSAYLSTEQPEESTDKTLSSLTIAGDYTLTPEFSSDVTEYTLNVPEDVTSLDIDATPTDDNAEVEITGNEQLLDGVNTIEITVTAEDGTARTYTISVTKGEFANIGLSELSVEGYTLTPEFTSDIHEYTLEINDLTVTSLNINAVADQDNATVEIVGNTGLQLGENIITILVKSEDDEEIATYQIIVNIVEKQEEQLIPGISNDELFLYGGIALGVLVLLIIIIAVVRHKRKAKREQEEAEPYYGGFDSLNKDTKKKDKDSDSKKDLGDTQDLNNVINNKNVPEATERTSKNEEMDPIRKHRRSVIEENFGADIKNEDDNNDKGGRKKGKHF